MSFTSMYSLRLMSSGRAPPTGRSLGVLCLKRAHATLTAAAPPFSRESMVPPTMTAHQRSVSTVSPSAVGGGGPVSSSTPPQAACSREVGLKRWRSSPTTVDSMTGTLSRLSPVALTTSREYNGVLFHAHERLDFTVTWMLPSSWTVESRAGQNMLNLQCAPQRQAPDTPYAPTVHGMSLTAFTYHHKAKAADSNVLMASFLKQFNKNVGGSLMVLANSADAPSASAASARSASTDRSIERCRRLASIAPGTTAEVSFRPPQGGGQVARGLCRAFYASTLRSHYIALFAVPQDEFEVMDDLISFAVASVLESDYRCTK